MKDSSFWISLLLFILFMCSCKTQKLDSNIQTREEVRSEISVENKEVKVDSSKIIHSEQLTENTVIKETIIVTEYDKESGKPIKETHATREIRQDSNKILAEEEDQSVTECNELEAEHSRESTKKIDSEVKEESVGGQEAFGKYLGIVIGIAISFLLLYLLQKLRVN